VIQRASENWNASARLRLGWARGPVLLYATGGAAWIDAELSTDITASTDFFAFGQFFSFNTTDRSRSHNEDVETGWTAGGGGQYAFSRRCSVALEYRHSGFENLTDSSRLAAPISATGRHVDLDNDQVTLRVNFLLGRLH
jgi:outer membrane immunogenic protein